MKPKYAELELIASVKTGGNLYSLTTSEPLGDVLRLGWFSRFKDHGLRRLDRILAITDAASDAPTFATLVVTAIDRHGVHVGSLGSTRPVDAEAAA